MRNIDCSVGRGWEAPCSPFSVSTAGASGGDQGPGKAGLTERKNKEVEGSRPGEPLSQPLGSHEPMTSPCLPMFQGASGHHLAPAGAEVLHLPRACTATAPPQGWRCRRVPAKSSALSQWDPHPEKAPGRALHLVRYCPKEQLGTLNWTGEWDDFSLLPHNKRTGVSD